MKRNYFTQRDRKHVEEIKKALHYIEETEFIDMRSEEEWLDKLNERFGKTLSKQQSSDVTVNYEINNIKKEDSDIEFIKAEIYRFGSDAYDRYTRDNSDKEYWTYMTCKKITTFIDKVILRKNFDKEVLAVIKTIKETLNK